MTIRISRGALEEKRHELAKAGVRLKGDSGSVETHGCLISYDYFSEELILDVVKKPFYIPMFAIESKLKAFFE